MKAIVRIAAVLLMLCVLTCTMTGCYSQTPTVTIEPIDDGTTTTTVAPNTKLTMQDLLVIPAETIAWSELENYDHTKNGDEATFVVTHDNGKTAKLVVKIDAASGNLSEATLSYEGQFVSILSESSLCLMPIFYAMSAEE